MTIPAGDTTINRYTGNGVTSTFDYDFKITAKTDLTVRQFDTNDVETVLTVDTDYTVTGVGNNDGGTITLTAGALTDGYTISIEDDVPVSQLVPFGNQSNFSGLSHENAFDKLTRIAKKALTQASLVVKLPSWWTGSDTLESLDAGDLIRVKTDLSGLEGVSPDSIADAPVYSDFVVDTFLDGTHYTSGTSTTLTLSGAPGTVDNTFVFFDGVYQEQGNYTLSDTTLTFLNPIPSGVSKIEIHFGQSLVVGYFDTSNVSYTTVTPDTATTHAITESDVGRLILFNTSSLVTVTLTAQSTVSLDAGFFTLVKNDGSGKIVLANEDGTVSLEGCPVLQLPGDETTIYLKDVVGATDNVWSTIGNIWVPTAVTDATLTAPPGTTPDIGNVYIPAATATGSWAGYENYLMIHTGSDAYYAQAPEDGMAVRDKTNGTFLVYDSVGDQWNEMYTSANGTVTLVEDQGECPLGNGLLLKWGKTAALAPDANATVSFDNAFPNAALNAQATTLNSGTGNEDQFARVISLSTTGIVVRSEQTKSGDYTGNSNIYWQAIGY